MNIVNTIEKAALDFFIPHHEVAKPVRHCTFNVAGSNLARPTNFVNFNTEVTMW